MEWCSGKKGEMVAETDEEKWSKGAAFRMTGCRSALKRRKSNGGGPWGCVGEWGVQGDGRGVSCEKGRIKEYFHSRLYTLSLHLWLRVAREKSWCVFLHGSGSHTCKCCHMHACECAWQLAVLCAFVRVMLLQTGGTRVPVHDEAGDRAANWPPQQTTSLCATPGCPQYLKTGSI